MIPLNLLSWYLCLFMITNKMSSEISKFWSPHVVLLISYKIHVLLGIYNFNKFIIFTSKFMENIIAIKWTYSQWLLKLLDKKKGAVWPRKKKQRANSLKTKKNII